MKRYEKMWYAATCYALFAATLAGCSGGSDHSNALLGGGAPTHAGPMNPIASSAVKRRFTIMIPQKRTTSATAVRNTSSTRRLPQYVSYGTQGLGIITSLDDKQIDSESFSTNRDNPNCTRHPDLGGITCTFTVGVVGGNDKIGVLAYDVEPTTPTGGNSTAFPAGAHLLSGDYAFVTIDTGVNTPIGLSLQGVPASAQLTSPTFPKLSTTGDSTPVSTIGGQSPLTTTVALDALDASGYVIVGNDQLTSPVLVKVEESGGSGHTTVALQSTDDSGNVSTSPFGPALYLFRASDQVVVAYDGKASFGYEAQFDVAFSATEDPTGVGSVAGAAGQGSLAPLFVNVDPDFATNAPHATFGFDPATGMPILSETLESGPSENPTFTFAGASVSTQGQDENAPAAGRPRTESCSTSSFPTGSSVPYVADFTGGSAQTCIYQVGDGTASGQEQLEMAYTPPTGVSLFPSSFVGICGPDDIANTCSSAYENLGFANEFTTATTTPIFSVVSCTADAHSGCNDAQNFTGGANSRASCVNNSGLLSIDQYGVMTVATTAYDGRFGNDSSDPNAQDTGDFSCTFGISDGAGTIEQYSESLHVSSTGAARARHQPNPYSKASVAYGRQAAAQSSYAALLAKRKATAATVGAQILTLIRKQESR